MSINPVMNHIMNVHPKVKTFLEDKSKVEQASDYIGSRIRLSPVVISITANGTVIDLFEVSLNTSSGYSIKIKDIIDIHGNQLYSYEDTSESSIYTIRTDVLDKVDGDFYWNGTSIYIKGTVHIVCYCYPSFKIKNEWSSIMLLFLIPYVYYKIALSYGDVASAGIYETYLNRLINFYNNAKNIPLTEKISEISGVKPYDL